MRVALFALIPAIALAACASDGAPTGYSAELAKLERDCTVRGGMLAPMRGGTGQPSTDYYCSLRGPDAGFRSAVGGDAAARGD